MGSQRGSVLLTMLITLALIAGGAILLRMQLVSTRSASLVTDGLSALNCAEAGLVAARPAVAANFAGWSAALCNPPPPRGSGACVIGSPAAEPAWLAGVPHDVDGDGTADLALALVDNDDELPVDPLHDADSTIYLISTCTLRETRVQLSELLHYESASGTLTRRLWLRTE